MSERTVDATEIVQKRYTEGTGLIDKDEIIDVSAFDFDDTDGWLYLPKQCTMESTVHDLYTWLKSEPELTLPNIESSHRKCIDTRTFTRPKKRSSRTSFESIFEAMLPSSVNTWKTQGSNLANTIEDISRSPNASIGNKEEVIPSMLKTVPTTVANIMLEEHAPTSGQESMEVFLNMSHSKGIDSFINLTEPGFSDPIMNVSQPSIFYSSITSLPREDSLNSTDCNNPGEPGSLTHSINHCTSKLEEVAISNNINETFSRLSDTAKGSKGNSIIAANETYTHNPEWFEKMELNETYNAEMAANTLVLSRSHRDITSTTDLSSTYVNKCDGTIKVAPQQAKERKDVVCLDATYLPSELDKNNSVGLDRTYSSIEPEKQDKNATTVLENDVLKGRIANCNIGLVPVQSPRPSVNSSFSSVNDRDLDSTFKLPISLCQQSTPKNLEALNSTFKTITKQVDQTRLYNAALSQTFKAPSSLRRELLAEIQRSGERRLESTYNHIETEPYGDKERKQSYDGICDQNIQNDIPVENKYNTYKKEPSADRAKIQTESISGNAGACAQKDVQDRKFYTFTKKSGFQGGKTDMENAESLEDADSTFTKPFLKLQKKKTHVPRMLSKLPQFLQKSNPNLVSGSLKAVGPTSRANASNMTYMKGSQPNIVRDVEKSLSSKLYALGKMKSGSEQRLLELNTNPTDFQMTGAGGSTESIESTQSAHSAPDLDDRLSTCSDSSHNSYTTQPMNIEQLHQIVRMQEESLKQETTPKLNRRVLENTWIDEKKNLPSPILKNGIDGCESDSSPLAIDYTVKTSSPLLSPTGSSQSINTESHPVDNMLKQQNEVTAARKVEALNKPVARFENKTRLRPPTNYNTGNRAPTAISAIPRPPSRIPALRFARPIGKGTQADAKRGYM